MHANLTQPRAPRDLLTDEQIEALNDVVDAEALEDVRHEMRAAWNSAVGALGSLNPLSLPVIEHGRLELRSLPEVIGQFAVNALSCVLLANVLRGATPDALHHYLRTAWINANEQGLAEIGWRADAPRKRASGARAASMPEVPLEVGDNAGVPSFTELSATREARHV